MDRMQIHRSCNGHAARALMRRGFVAALALAASAACALPPAAVARPDQPSRAPAPKCAWERISDSRVRLAAWVQRCDYGFRKIDFLVQDNSLAIRYSDGGAPDPLVDVIDLLPGERAEAGVRRVFAAHTDPALARRCVLSPFRGSRAKPPPGVKRYAFVPNPVYRKALRANSDPNEVDDPACGDWGESPDGIQYFEVHPKSAARKILFVRIGQDEPLFDEQSLRLIGK